MISQSPALQLRAGTLAREQPRAKHSRPRGNYNRAYTPNPKDKALTDRKGPNNQPTVPVLDKNGTPLSPARPSRVRSWLECGRGSKVWIENIFAVQLHDVDAANAITQPMALGLDIGKTTGIAITRETDDGSSREIVGAYEHIHRNNQIKKRLADRSDYRSGRRGRLRQRPQRSKNRANALAKGRIPPSLRNLIDDYTYITDTFRKLYPITRIRIEYLKFDTQLIQNPDISGKEYQYGTLHQRQLRRYILARDNNTCRYCGKPGTGRRRLELDHVIPKSKGGPTRPDNIVASCRPCNKKKHNKDVEVFLAKKPAILEDIRNQLKKLVPLTDAGQLNTVMPSVLEILKATGLPVTTTDGVTTSYGRDQLGIEKSHVNDAACLDLPQHVSNLVARITILKRQGRHRRQSIQCEKNGRPKGDEFPDYSRLPRSRQGFTTPPAHSTGPRRLNGISSGDIVRVQNQKGRQAMGRVTMKLKDQRTVIKGKPEVSCQASRANLCAYRHRWAVSLSKQTSNPPIANYE